MCRSVRSAFTGIVGRPSDNELVFVNGLKACKLELPNDDVPPRQRVNVKSECVSVAHKPPPRPSECVSVAHKPPPRPTSSPQPGPVKAGSEVKPSAQRSEASSASSRSPVPKQPAEPPPAYLCRVTRQMEAENEPAPKPQKITWLEARLLGTPGLGAMQRGQNKNNSRAHRFSTVQSCPPGQHQARSL